MLYAPLMHLLSFTGWNHTYLTKEIYLSLKHISTESSKYHTITKKKFTGDGTNFHHLWTLNIPIRHHLLDYFEGLRKLKNVFLHILMIRTFPDSNIIFQIETFSFFRLQGDVKKRQIGGKRKDRNKQRKDFRRELMIFPLNTYMHGYNEWRRKY